MYSPHQALRSFGFSGSPSHATSTGKSYGSKVTRNWVWGNPRGPSFQDRGPRDPKWVPWDQNFGLKNFLMPSSNDVILCVSEVCWSKNAENWQKQVILGTFGHKIAKTGKMTCFCQFSPFFDQPSPKTHKITSFEDGMRKFLSKKNLVPWDILRVNGGPISEGRPKNIFKCGFSASMGSK